MTWQLLIRAAAKRDINEARDWYNEKDRDLDDEFRIEITKSLARLLKSPNRSPLYYGPYYRSLLKRFPYKIFYRIEAIGLLSSAFSMWPGTIRRNYRSREVKKGGNK